MYNLKSEMSFKIYDRIIFSTKKIHIIVKSICKYLTLPIALIHKFHKISSSKINIK